MTGDMQDDFARKAVAIDFFRATKLREMISRCTEKAFSVSALQTTIRNLLENRSIDLDGAVTPMVELAEQKLPQESGAFPLRKNEGDRLSAQCDRIRYALFAASLIAKKSDDRLRALEDLANDVVQDDAAMVEGKGGTMYGTLDNSFLLLLPNLRTEEQCRLVSEELETAYDTVGKARNWVIDFSLVDTIPSIMFLGGLRAYRDTLEKNGLLFSLTWVTPALFASKAFEILNDKRPLVSRVGHLFTPNEDDIE